MKYARIQMRTQADMQPVAVQAQKKNAHAHTNAHTAHTSTRTTSCFHAFVRRPTWSSCLEVKVGVVANDCISGVQVCPVWAVKTRAHTKYAHGACKRTYNQ